MNHTYFENYTTVGKIETTNFNTKSTKTIYECDKCGSIVLNTSTHNLWHELVDKNS